MLDLSPDVDTRAQGLKKLVYVAKEDPTKVTAYHDGLQSEIEKAGGSKPARHENTPSRLFATPAAKRNKTVCY